MNMFPKQTITSSEIANKHLFLQHVLFLLFEAPTVRYCLDAKNINKTSPALMELRAKGGELNKLFFHIPLRTTIKNNLFKSDGKRQRGTRPLCSCDIQAEN